MSVKSTTKRSPRAMPVETIITRYKSAQQKLKIDKESTKVTAKKKLKHKSERKLKAKFQKKQVKEIEKKKKKEEEPTREFYPERSKRETSNKKIVLMPKHCLKLIGGTNGCNKRKMQVPRKEITKRTRDSSRSSTPSELSTDSPKHREMSIKDMVLWIEEQGGLDEEDLLEILTCPSPVWWEDPPAGYMEDPILTRPRSVERKSVKNQLIEEQIKEAERKKQTEVKEKSVSANVNDVNTKNLGITTLDVSIRNRDVDFMNKRCKLESLLGNIKSKVKKYRDNTQLNNDILENSSTTSMKTDKTNVTRIDDIKEVEKDVAVNNKKKRNSDSFEEDSILNLDDEGILSLENINIPIAPNGMLANVIDTAVVEKVTNAACPKKGSSKTKSERDVQSKRFCNSKSLLRPEYNNKNKRCKKDSPVKIKIPVSTNRTKVRSNDKNKNIKINAPPLKIEDISNDIVSNRKEPFIIDTKKSVNEIDRIFIIDDHISNTVKNIGKSPKIENESSKDCEMDSSFIKIDTSVKDTLREVEKNPLKLEATSEVNVRQNKEILVKSENSIFNKNTTRENKGTFVDIKEDISNQNLSEIEETNIKIKDNIAQSIKRKDKSIEIIDIISDYESDIDTSFDTLKNSNEMRDSIKKEYENDARRVSIDSDVSDRNMSEEYLDMSVFDEEDQKIELVPYNQNSVYNEVSKSDVEKLTKGYSRGTKRRSKIGIPVNINTGTDSDGQYIFDETYKSKVDEINNIYNLKQYVKEEKQYLSENSAENHNVDIENTSMADVEHKSPEYIEVYKIINSDSDNETSLSKNKDVDKNGDDLDKTELKLDKLDKPLNFYYKQRKIIKKSSNKTKDQDINKEVKVQSDCDCNFKNKSVLVSDDDGVKYCMICSSIFDTESCKYCMRKSKKRCSCENRTQYECNICNVILNGKAAIRHIKDHKYE